MRTRLYQALISERQPEDRHVARYVHIRFLFFGGAVLDREDPDLKVVDPAVRHHGLRRQVPRRMSQGKATQLLVEDPQFEPMMQPTQRIPDDWAVFV